VPGWEYRNCYSDDWERTLPEARGVHDNLTPEGCASMCDGYEYFGVENGNECFCGQTIDASKVALESECSVSCTGDGLLICGGGWRLTVYHREPTSIGIQSVQGWRHVDCFSDAEVRTLPDGPRGDNAMTPSLCAGLCATSAFFGVENGNECFCGNSLDRSKIVDPLDPWQCDVPCGGNSLFSCGGGWRLIVYEKEAGPTSGTSASSSTTRTSSTTTPTSTTSTSSPTPSCPPPGQSCESCGGSYNSDGRATCKNAPFAGCACQATLAMCGQQNCGSPSISGACLGVSSLT
jgi:hypothetical protein